MARRSSLCTVPPTALQSLHCPCVQVSKIEKTETSSNCLTSGIFRSRTAKAPAFQFTCRAQCRPDAVLPHPAQVFCMDHRHWTRSPRVLSRKDQPSRTTQALWSQKPPASARHPRRREPGMPPEHRPVAILMPKIRPAPDLPRPTPGGSLPSCAAVARVLPVSAHKP